MPAPLLQVQAEAKRAAAAADLEVKFVHVNNALYANKFFYHKRKHIVHMIV